MTNRNVPALLQRDSYETVEANMLGQSSQYSFAQQMARAVQREPLAFLVTANSAIPVADSIRGFYEEIEAELPVIDYIRVPRFDPFTALSERAERKRLRRRLPETPGRIYVVDEFVFSGGTLKRAANLLTDIGEFTVSQIMGKWYMHASRKDINVDRVTSIHAPTMKAIGQTAAKLAF